MIPLSRQSACASTAEEKAKNAKLKPKRRKIRTEPKQLHEDVCFQCGDGGELVMCDRKDCPKAYHLLCLNLPQPPYGERPRPPRSSPRGPCHGKRRGQRPEQAPPSARGGCPWTQGWGLVFPEVGSWPLWCGTGGRAHSHPAGTMQTSRGPRPGAVVSRTQPPARAAGGRWRVWWVMDLGTH